MDLEVPEVMDEALHTVSWMNILKVLINAIFFVFVLKTFNLKKKYYFAKHISIFLISFTKIAMDY